MTSDRMERRLAAILSADVVGYSGLMEADEAGTLTRLQSLRRELIDLKIGEHNGRIVKQMGDGILVEFASVIDATNFAVALQRAVAQQNAGIEAPKRLLLRIGINLGDIIADGDDIYGDGVNVAARLEGLADPGGICISGAAYDQIEGKLDLACEDLGLQTVKNLTKPVRVYRVVLDDTGLYMKRVVASLELADKPSIAVLPLDNMSGDPQDEFFADGMTEDIITALSRFPTLFVIARNSSFVYKGRPVRVQEIGRELGVRYVVEGSTRKAGDRVRVNVQLIDAETGNHIWADRYDRALVDMFDVQDELTQAIVAALPGRIGSAEESRLKRKVPQDMAAYDYLILGKIHHHRVTATDNAEALRLLQRAIELDPDFAEAYAWRGCTFGQALQFGFGSDPEELEEQAVAAITRALSLDENNVECHRLLCEVHMDLHELDQAAVHGARAIALNPNDPRIVAQQGELMTWLGRSDEAVEWLEKAMRLDPHGMVGRLHLLGRALFGTRRYADALEAFRQITSPRNAHRAAMAACFGLMGARDEAKKQVEAVLKHEPSFSIASHVASLPYAEKADQEHLADGLRKAGLPE